MHPSQQQVIIVHRVQKKKKKTKIPVSIFAVRTGICAILLGRWTVVVAQLKNMAAATVAPAFPDPE